MFKRLALVLPVLLCVTTIGLSADAQGKKKRKKPAPAPIASASASASAPAPATTATPTSSDAAAPAATDGEPPWGQTAQEKQAVRESMKQIDESLAKARKACGNPNLTVSVEWASYGKFEDKAAEDSGRTRHNIYGMAGDLVGIHLRNLASLCTDYPDYKKAGSTVKVFHAKPTWTKDIGSSKAVSFSRKGGDLYLTFDVMVSNDSNDALKSVL